MVTLLLLSNDLGLGESDLGLAEWARLASLGSGCFALRSIHGVEEPVPSAVQGTPGSESKAGRFRAALEASNKDPAMRRLSLAIGVLDSAQDDNATSPSFRGSLFFRAGGVAYRG
jgi:hypothetical protein